MPDLLSEPIDHSALALHFDDYSLRIISNKSSEFMPNRQRINIGTKSNALNDSGNPDALANHATLLL